MRRAAAAAADERAPLDSALLMKALEAASEAEALGGGARWAGLEAALRRLPNMVGGLN